MLCFFFFYVDLWNLQPQVFGTTDPEWGLVDPIKPGTLHKDANKQRESKTDSVSQQALWFTSRYYAAFHEYSEAGISTLQVGSSPKSHSPWSLIQNILMLHLSLSWKQDPEKLLHLRQDLTIVCLIPFLYHNSQSVKYGLCPSVWTGFMVLTRTLRSHVWCKRLFLLYLKRKET